MINDPISNGLIAGRLISHDYFFYSLCCISYVPYRFASALSVLAENRTLLEKIFVTKEVNSMGVYAMRLCKDGNWVDVVVDDRLPCLADGQLAFCKVRW